MTTLVANCPRCDNKHTTFDMRAAKLIGKRYGWESVYECFCVCRTCDRSTVFVLTQDHPDDEALHSGIMGVTSANNHFTIESFVSQKDQRVSPPPTDLPPSIEAVFIEGAKCLAVECFNASATMFRLSLDMATKELLPSEDIDGLNMKIRRSLGLRLKWLFQTGRLSTALEELASCVKEDGNDGAHEGSLNKADAEDLRDFSYVLLERLFTEPAKLKQAAERRAARRQQN